MTPKEVLEKWIDCFNKADAYHIAELYATNAVNHQVANEPIIGKESIYKMFVNEFATAKMVCMVENIFEDDVPYDLDAPVIEIPREDYGIWYVDMMENPARYRGKVIEITAKVLKPSGFPSKVFLPGRMAMTCCADDTTFLGYVCRSAYAPKLKAGQWVKVRAKVRFANVSVYRGEGPVLEAEHIEAAEPIEELVYFN